MSSQQIFLPGLVPRPQVFVERKQDCEETVESTSGATFLFVKDCNNLTLNVKGKTGKIVAENATNSCMNIHNRILGGTVELIRCHNTKIKLHQDSVVPIITLDSCTSIEISLCHKGQLQGVYFQFAENVVIRVHSMGIEQQWTDSYDVRIPTDATQGTADAPQWVAHWENTDASSSLITEKVERDDIFPMIEQMKKIAEAMSMPVDR